MRHVSLRSGLPVLSFASAVLALACSSPSPAPPAPTPSSPTAQPVVGSVAAPPALRPLASASAPIPSRSADAPAAAPAPAIDLAAEREARAKKAKEELGPRTVTTVVSDVFVVVGPPGWQGAAFEQSVALMRNAMSAFMNGRFGNKPAHAISVYLFADARGYQAFCHKQYAAPCIAHFGFYQPGDRYMVMNAGLGLGTLTHELVHPLVEADFPHAPTWINEGIASVFEQPLLPKSGEIHGGKNWRHPRLKKALAADASAERERARLDGLFRMSDETFRGEHEDLNYATARYVCQWLDERGKLWPFYQRWRDTHASDPTGEAAFREVVGMSPAEAHAVWSKWALAL